MRKGAKLVLENPKGRIVVQDGKSKLEWNYDFQRFNNQYSRAQKWLDNQILTDCDKHIPFQSSALRKSGILGTDIGSGIVEWDAPYARYQYYGKVMVGPPPKQLTDKPLKYWHPGTGPYWFEEAKSIHKRQWIDGAGRLAGGG